MLSHGLGMLATSCCWQSPIMELVIGGPAASRSCELLSMGGLGGLLSCLGCGRRGTSTRVAKVTVTSDFIFANLKTSPFLHLC